MTIEVTDDTIRHVARLSRIAISESELKGVRIHFEKVLAFIEFWNREKAHPFKWTFTGYPLRTGHELGRAA